MLIQVLSIQPSLLFNSEIKEQDETYHTICIHNGATQLYGNVFLHFQKFFCPTNCEMACILSDVVIKRSWFPDPLRLLQPLEHLINADNVSVFGLCMKLLRHSVARKLITSRRRDSFGNSFDSSNCYFLWLDDQDRKLCEYFNEDLPKTRAFSHLRPG